MAKQKIFIILAIILTIIFLFSLVFYFLIKDKEPKNEENPLNYVQEKEEIEVLKTPLEIINESFPHITESKFREYEEMVETNNFTNCYSDYDCVITSAYLLEDYTFCTRAGVHIHADDENEDHEEHREEEMKIIECSNFVLSKTLPEELSKCYEMEDRQRLLCSQNFIAPYKSIEDCKGVGSAIGVEICESVHRYREATMTMNSDICDDISDDFFKEYCFKHSVVN